MKKLSKCDVCNKVFLEHYITKALLENVQIKVCKDCLKKAVENSKDKKQTTEDELREAIKNGDISFK